MVRARYWIRECFFKVNIIPIWAKKFRKGIKSLPSFSSFLNSKIKFESNEMMDRGESSLLWIIKKERLSVFTKAV